MKEHENLIKTLLELHNHHITGILVYYAGQGDDGAIESICYTKEHFTDIQQIKELIPDNWDTKVQLHNLNTNLYSLVEELAYDLIDDIEDWYNDEGGHGFILIDVYRKTYNINNNIRVVHIDTYNHSGKLSEKF